MITTRSTGILRFLVALILGIWLSLPAAVSGGCHCGPDCQCGNDCPCGQWSPPPPANPDANRIRKNQHNLTDQEKQDFVAALKQLKTLYHDGATISIYDEYVNAHMDMQNDISHDVHRGPAFFPWHRALVRDLELELQALNPNVTIPYWDFTVDNTQDASLWAENFLGGNGDPDDGDAVKTGPFARGKWTLNFDGPNLRRQFANVFAPTLPTADQVQTGMAIPTYDSYPFDTGSPLDTSFRNYMTGWNFPDVEMHNRVHAWVGGSMLEMTSPNDPVFWLLHANFDRLWAEWEAIYGYDYPVEGAPEGQNLYDIMLPFGITPADVLDHHALGYAYDTESGGSPGPHRGYQPSKSQVVKVGQSLPAPAAAPSGQLPELPRWFKELAQESPGQISLYEWKAAGRALEEFRRLDLNNDGFITAEEVRRSLARPRD